MSNEAGLGEQPQSLVRLLQDTPIPSEELGRNLGLYIDRQNLSRILFIQHIYEMIVAVHGNIMEFGTRWGQNMALFHSFRGFYEPYNMTRRIIGFDTFAGFPEIAEEDGKYILAQKGKFGVTEGYEKHLESVLSAHELRSPLSHLRRYEIHKGDAEVKLREYLDIHPETIVALAFFDMDIYTPTKKCLELILPHLTKGSVAVFDELNVKEWPGETKAFREVLAFDRYAIKRCPYSSSASYVVIE
jgi:hypothetical protein